MRRSLFAGLVLGMAFSSAVASAADPTATMMRSPPTTPVSYAPRVFGAGAPTTTHAWAGPRPGVGSFAAAATASAASTLARSNANASFRAVYTLTTAARASRSAATVAGRPANTATTTSAPTAGARAATTAWVPSIDARFRGYFTSFTPGSPRPAAVAASPRTWQALTVRPASKPSGRL